MLDGCVFVSYKTQKSLLTKLKPPQFTVWYFYHFNDVYKWPPTIWNRLFYFFWKGKGNSSQATDFFLAGVFFSKRASLVNHQSLTFCMNFTNFKGYNSSWKRKLIKDDFSDQSDCLPLDFLVLKVTSQFLQRSVY